MGADSPPPAAAAPAPRPGRGACGLVFAAVGAAAAVVAADAALSLSLPARIALWVGWIGLVLLLARRPRAVPWPAAAAAVAATVGAAVVVPGAAHHLRRVFTPWDRPPAAAGVRVVVTSGEPVVPRDGPVTLSALVEPLGPDAVLPETADLLLRLHDGRTARAPMTADGAGGFHLTRGSVSADFDYRVEAGGAVSPWHAVRVGDPVGLADGTSVTITPPGYAGPAAPVTRPGFTSVEGLQHATAAVRLVFTHPAATAYLQWQPAGGPAEVVHRPVQLLADGRVGTATLRLTGDGTLRLVAVSDPWPRRLRSEFVVPVKVVPDAPPRFEAVDGIVPRAVTAPPGGAVELTFTAADDHGVAGAVLEVVPGSGGEPAALPVALSGAATPRADGRVMLPLAGRGVEGETVRYRLRIADNRRVADANLGPQESFYPSAGWAEVRLSRAAPPADAQEAFGLRDLAREAIEAAKQATDAARSEAAELAASPELAAWPVDHAIRLDAARGQLRKGAAALHDAAAELALRPDLRPFAGQVRAEADRLLGVAGEHFAEAPPDRRAALSAGAARLAESASHLAELEGRNERAARDGLDRRRLLRLAGEADRPGAADRLRAMIADSPALSRSVAAAADRDARRFAAEAESLADRVRELDAAAERLRVEVRRELAGRVARLQGRTADEAAAVLARVGTAARLARVSPPPVADFRKGATLLADDQLVDALVELETLARALDQLAAAFDAAGDERADPKVAARQLAAWAEDLHARFAAATKAGPFAGLPDTTREAFRAEARAALAAALRLHLPPTAEVVSLRDAAAGHLRQADARLSGDGVGAGQPLKLAAGALDRLADRMPTAADRRKHARDELAPLRAEVEAVALAADGLIRTADRQFARRLQPYQVRQEAVADQLAKLDFPGLEARHARAVAAARAAAADLKAGLPLDAAASLAWSLREIDRLRQTVDPPPDAAADELVRLQRAVNAAGAQGEVGRRLGLLAAPEAPALSAAAKEAVRRAEAAYRDTPKGDEPRQRAAAAADALARLADRLNGRESDRDRVDRLAGNRRRAADAAKGLAGRPLNTDASTEARKELLREVDELNATRVGPDGQAAKRRVLDQYARLRDKAEPDRDAGGQAALADALDDLAGVAGAVPELTVAPGRIVGPPEPDPADAYLPSRRLAGLLRDLARRERAVRERANAVADETARRLRPAAGDRVAAAVARQRTLATAADGLARSLPGRADAAAAAWACRAVLGPMEVGLFGDAKAAADRAAARMKAVAAATDPPTAGVAAELAARQNEIVADLTAWLDRPEVAAAQQAARQAALAAEATAFADRLDKVKDDERIGEAAAGPARAAGRALADGKPRDEAEGALRQAAEAVMSEVTTADDDDARDRAVGDALRAASAALRGIKPDGKAAEALRRAAEAIGG